MGAVMGSKNLKAGDMLGIASHTYAQSAAGHRSAALCHLRRLAAKTRLVVLQWAGYRFNRNPIFA